MKCLYYPAPTLDSAHRISDDLRAMGVTDVFAHVISQDEAGLAKRRIPSSNYLETLNLLRDGFIGSALGLIAGLLGAGLLGYFQPFGPNVPGLVFLVAIAAATLFGAWEGGLTGIAKRNRKLTSFQDDIEAGRYLVLVYAVRAREAAVRRMMRARHPEARLAAVDRHCFNPFGALRRRAILPRPEAVIS